MSEDTVSALAPGTPDTEGHLQADQLIEKIDEIARIFAETKQA